MCEATRLLRYGVRRLYETSTTTTSSAVVVTPQAVVSTIVTSSRLGQPTDQASPSPTSNGQSAPSSSARDSASSTSSIHFWSGQVSNGQETTDGEDGSEGDSSSTWDGGGEGGDWESWRHDQGPEGSTLGNNALAEAMLTRRPVMSTTSPWASSDGETATRPDSSSPRPAQTRTSTATLTSTIDRPTLGTMSTMGETWTQESDRGVASSSASFGTTHGDLERTVSSSARISISVGSDANMAASKGDEGQKGSIPSHLSREDAVRISASWVLNRDDARIGGEWREEGGEHDQRSYVDLARGTQTAQATSTELWRPSLRDRAKRQQCSQWTTFTSFSTAYTTPSTSWSTFTVIETSSRVDNAPVQTLYASCEPTTTAAVAAAVPSPSAWEESVTTRDSEDESTSPAATSAGPDDAGEEMPTQVQQAAGQAASPSRTSELIEPGVNRAHAAEASPDLSATALEAGVSALSAPSKTLSSGGTTAHSPILASTNGSDAPISTPRPTADRGEPGSTTVQSDDDNQGSSTSKGVSAGAAIGGIVGLLSLLGGILMVVRWYKRRKRKHKTEHLRSSWFYGGDAALPDERENEKIESRVRDEGHASGGAYNLQSRFSAPSLLSHHSGRFPRSVPAFLALPISHMRNSSAKFPNIIDDVRKSFAFPKGRTAVPSWAQRHHANIGQGPAGEAAAPGESEVSLRSAPAIDYSRHQSIMPFDWEPSFPALQPAHHDAGRGFKSDYQTYSARSSSNVNGVLGDDGRPLESYYSVYSAQSYYPEAVGGDRQRPSSGTGQAITAPGRESIEAFTNFSLRHTPSLTGPDARPSASRTLVRAPTALDVPVPHFGKVSERASAAGQSSLFEYSDFDRHSRRASAATGRSATTHGTQEWFEDPTWASDAEISPLAQGFYSELSRSAARRGVLEPQRPATIPRSGSRPGIAISQDSGDEKGGAWKGRKSVRWGDEVVAE